LTAFYDLHTHILPGVDDGPTNIEDSVAMARVAAEDGTVAILATPHNQDVTQNHSIDYIKNLVEKFRQELKSKNVQIEILLGMENHLEPNLPQHVSDGNALPINATRYILVELPFTIYPNHTEEVLFKLRLQGLTPVIAHPERNSEIQRNPLILKSLVEEGILAQVTAGSLLGSFGREAKKSSETLLRRGLVHIIASDTHHYFGPRNPALSAGVAAAARIVGDQRAQNMAGNTPKAILNNEVVEIEPITDMVFPKPWWRFW